MVFIKFEDVREGDRIKVYLPAEHTFDTKVTNQIEGTAHTFIDYIADPAWFTEHKHILVTKSDTDIELISRPERNLPTATGSLIEVTEIRGIRGRWVLMLSDTGSWWSSLLINGFYSHSPWDITAWKEIDLG